MIKFNTQNKTVASFSVFSDKKSLYVWMFVLLANIGIVSIDIESYFGIGFAPLSGSARLLTLSLFLTALPVWISQSDSRFRHYFGYGIPFLFLIPTSYFVYTYHTCTGYWCDIGPYVFGWLCGVSAVIFLFFYIVGCARKWNIKFILYLIAIVILLLAIGWWIYYVF